MGFTFVAADWFGHTVVLSGEASRPASVTGPFDRESLNSVEQTFTVMVVSFMVAPTDYTDSTDEESYASNAADLPIHPQDECIEFCNALVIRVYL